ncbi:hypothetical protein GE107_02530 [Cohnella sp. CFH 77786]|uniref:spore germination protein GerPC n=1 Tax=Cohnella sp. CFH 77786 TaxID=2662265 RepID=UPI001C60F6F1|nr:spore germination protein GerPC [Cohnella sp. CFH 77786]MBW5444941.1 hypothetical protein [Cohnella sp. CFH 77786]
MSMLRRIFGRRSVPLPPQPRPPAPAPSPVHEELVRRLDGIERQLARLAEERTARPPVVIEHADKVVIEKLAYSNHFDTLSIETLTGRLNIGVNYQGVAPPDELLPVGNPKPQFPAKPAQPPPNADGPSYRIRARNQKDRPPE